MFPGCHPSPQHDGRAQPGCFLLSPNPETGLGTPLLAPIQVVAEVRLFNPHHLRDASSPHLTRAESPPVLSAGFTIFQGRLTVGRSPFLRVAGILAVSCVNIAGIYLPLRASPSSCSLPCCKLLNAEQTGTWQAIFSDCL